MMEYLPNLLLSWSIQLTGALSPGPSVALIVSVALSRGRLPAFQSASGVAAGSGILACATALGITAIFARFTDFMTVVRLLGAVYLAWLAFNAFRDAMRQTSVQALPEAPKGRKNPAMAGLLLQISNPKALLFWLAIASVGGVGDAPLLVKIVFVIGACAVSFAAHGGYGLALSVAPVRLVYAAARRWIEGAFGCFFMFASYKLATSKM
jgi:threonine/homoserine/homoserine lactone efflux protein